MKKKLLFLLLLIILFVGFIAVRFYILERQNSNGRLKVISSPSAGVFIDNVARGRTPFEEKLEAGEYMLKLIPEGVATDTVSWEGKVTITKNTLTFVNRELGSSDITSAGETLGVTNAESVSKRSNYGEIFIETEPNGAIVYLNNDEKGVSPLVLSDVLAGEHELSVFMPGFFRRTQKINVDSGYRVTSSFKLAVDQTQKRLEDIEDDIQASAEAELIEEQREYVRILDTPTGWLRVRSEPSLNGDQVTRVNPGEEYELIEEVGSWFEIQIKEEETGWISSDYAERIDEQSSEEEEVVEEEETTESEGEDGGSDDTESGAEAQSDDQEEEI